MTELTIDPHQYRFRNAWHQLTAVRIVTFIFRLIGRLFAFGAEIAWRIIRGVGLTLIDGAYSVKLKLVDMKYAERRRRIGLRSFGRFVLASVLLLPRLLVSLIRGSGSLVKESARRGQAGVSQEARRAFARPSGPRRPAIWSLLNFVLTLCLILLPVLGYAQWRRLDSTRGEVFSAVKLALGDLFSAKNFLEQRDIGQASHAFTQASANFLKARDSISSINGILLTLARVVPDERFRLAASARHLAAAGQLSSQLGEKLTAALALPAGTQPSTTAFLDNFLVQAEAALPLSRQLRDELAKVQPEALPAEYREDFVGLAAKASFLVDSLEESIEIARQAQTFLGEKMDKRYLLVFQNNTEKRGSGGSIGSYALVDFKKGAISGLTVPKGGSYDTEAGLSRLIAAPAPLALLNPLWHFWDANWWPDWPMSARKLMWFFEKSNGPTVDGVISLTPTVIEKVLAVIGPIDMTAAYGTVISADNFWEVTQTFSEQKPDVTREPKKIIGDLIDAIIVEVPKRMNPEMAVKLVGALEDSFAEKQALLYFTDKSLQSSVRRFGWGGEMLSTAGDYLMVVNTNIGGQKTDRVIRETYEHDIKILPDASILDTLTIRREHTASKGQLFVGVRNVDWLRVYVPLGSELVSADGFRSPDSVYFEEPDPSWERDRDLAAEAAARTFGVAGTKIYEENGKTVFANWSMIDPGETAVIRLTYRLPFSVKTIPRGSGWKATIKNLIYSDPSPAYSLLVQKQPGAAATAYRAVINSQLDSATAWSYPPALTQTADSYQLEQLLAGDIFAALLFKP